MSAPTDLALLAQFTSGQITNAEYNAEMQARNQAAKTAYTIAMLQNTQGVSPTLIASEVALQRASLQRAQQQAAREAEAQRQAATNAAALRAQQAKVDAARRAKDSAAAARAQVELRRQQQAAADARAAAVRAEQARRHAEEQRVSQLAEAARQKMIAETGRVVAAEQQGRIVAEAMAIASAEQEIAAGNSNDASLYFANTPDPTYLPIEEVETGIPYVGAAPVDRGRGTVIFSPPPVPPVDYVPVSNTAVINPAAQTPTVAGDLGSPSDAWNDSVDTAYAPVVGQAQALPGQNPSLYMTDQQKASQDLGKHVGISLLIGGLGLLLTGVWIQT